MEAYGINTSNTKIDVVSVDPAWRTFFLVDNDKDAVADMSRHQ
jgi:hypothetical protein